MSFARRIAATLGVALAVVGLVALAVPGVLGSLPTDRAMVLVLGVLLVLGGLRELQRRRATDREYAETPDTEEVVELPTPGDEFDKRFDRLSMTRYRTTERERLREEVEEVTEETLVRRRGLSPEAARESMYEGTWTDDPYAAAVFSGQAPAVGRVERVREYFSSRPTFTRRTERVAAELAALVDDPQEPGPRTGDAVEVGSDIAGSAERDSDSTASTGVDDGGSSGDEAGSGLTSAFDVGSADGEDGDE